MSNFFLRVSLQDKILFTKNLSLTLKAGVSLVNGLKMFQNQTKSKSFKRILKTLIEDTNKGIFLSTSLAKYRSIFGGLFVNIIKIAEASGTLPENLLYLGSELEKKSALRKKVKGAMVYPIVILIATIVIATTMIIFVFPKILPLFNSLDAELPLTTRILIGISNLVTNHGILILGAAIVLIVGFRFLLRIQSIRFIYHQMLFYVPIFGHAIVNYNMANFTRTLALLLRSGVKIIEALNISGSSLNNLVYRAALERSAESVRTGGFLSKHLANDPKRFPTTLVNMIEVGENTGNLTENLFYLAEYYENELDDFVKNLSGILEPVLLLFMGGIVGFIALSFITPIYEITRSIK